MAASRKIAMCLTSLRPHSQSAGETAKISTKAGKQSSGERQQLGEFLNFCPIISIEGSQMKQLDTEHMLQQLKRVYVERVVQNGFEDGYLYNDKLMRLTDVDIKSSTS